MGSKKKRKESPLTALGKATAIACGLSKPLNPSDVRESLKKFREDYKGLSALLGLQNGPAEQPSTDSDSVKFQKDISQKGNFVDYICVVRKMVLGYWMSNKVVYRIPNETINFIESEFRVEELEINMNTLIWNACRYPIYLEMTDWKPFTGAFCGCTSLLNENIPNSGFTSIQEQPVVYTTIVQEDCYVTLHRSQNMSVKEAVKRDLTEDAEKSRNASLVLKLLAYIGYARSCVDAEGSVFVEQPMQNGACYEVRPIPFKDSLPDMTSAHGWLKSGLCSIFGYLSRERMLHDFKTRLALDGEEGPYTFDPVNPDQNLLEMYVYRMVTEWEENKSVYQYDSKIGSELYEKYGDDLLREGFSADLVQFLPYRTVVLYQADQLLISVVSTCCVRDSKTPGLFIATFGGGAPTATIFELGKSPLSGQLGWCCGENFMYMMMALSAMYHVLTVLKAKTIKKWTKDALSADQKEGLVPIVETKPRTAQDKTEPPESLRIGYSIAEGPPLQLFDLTARTVKRVPQKELAERNGWKMSPHVRRQHPHRYWVGKGADKHLEVRVLGEMYINTDKKAPLPTTVVHKIESL